MEKQNAEIVTVKVLPNRIGAIIGSGGRTIKEIVATTKTQIDIEQDGLVKISGGGDADLDRAVRWVKTLGGQIEKGDVYEGEIRRVVDFGLFVALVPGLDGLVHVSNIPQEKRREFAKEYRVGEIVRVSVLEYDPSNGRVGLRIVEETA